MIAKIIQGLFKIVQTMSFHKIIETHKSLLAHFNDKKIYTMKSHCEHRSNFHKIKILSQSNLTTNTTATFTRRATSQNMDDRVTMLLWSHEVEAFLHKQSARRNCSTQDGNQA